LFWICPGPLFVKNHGRQAERKAKKAPIFDRSLYGSGMGSASDNVTRPYRALLVYVDAGFGPQDPLSARLNVQFDFTYDPAALAFDARNTSLLFRGGSDRSHHP
jgi:hypothetical protein